MVQDYLRVRRALGFALVEVGHTLEGFLAYLHAHGSDAVTIDNALAYATAAQGASRRTQALRLSAVRGFTRWAHTLDASIQVPPARLLPARPTRAVPFIYTTGQVADLLGAADRLHPAIRAATFHALVALMAATGIRTGEALGLGLDDFDPHAGTLTVTGKYHKIRTLPLHHSVVDALGDYVRQCPRPRPAGGGPPPLLISRGGGRLGRGSVHPTFRSLTAQVGLTAVSPACRPRLHDLRHTFAVNTLLDAYRRGEDPNVTLPILSTWLGHADPGDTYWYYSDSRVIPMPAPSCA